MESCCALLSCIVTPWRLCKARNSRFWLVGVVKRHVHANDRMS
jgi:hypothetical protein